MANQIETKKITTLTENTDLSDTDQFPFGAGGGSGLRRIKWINIWNKILAKMRAAIIIQNATTAATDKVASAAVTKNLQDQITEQNTKILKYACVTIASVNEADYLTWEVPTQYGKIVNIWNDDRSTSMITITGFSYFDPTSRFLIIHFGSVYRGQLRLGLLYYT